ncbi:Crp/Fnr family transcriptional regulator [Pseudobacteroides cellulosolvens]|uniref:Crp/Fnr family transcriptional regulator n=1 Tax=Pseudobacteroides cellulosolvens TaxID=35825 RepID=UPI00055DAE1A|nr:Crp/Fnr family transcriptional regulator [Pseudobacteroides cellulosolvens]
MMEKYLTSLKKAPLFNSIDENELLTMLKCINPKIVSYKKNDYIALAGEKFNSLGIIAEGEASISMENAAGNRIMMAILKAGDMFGEMLVFSKLSAWPANVQAQEPCTVFFLQREKIIGECEKMCSWHRTLIQNMLVIISERALMLNKKLEYLSIKSIRGKLSKFLLEESKKAGNTTFMLPMNRNELSDFLNVSRPSMSREMCLMRDEEIIDFHLSSIKILNVDALKSFL